MIMATLKAGCILVKKETKEVALVFREKQKDFSFPKGHKEEGESLEECAVRETAEETKRIARLIKNFNPIIERYITPEGEECESYLYLAVDEGASDNNSLDTHDTYWIPFDMVEEKLTYNNQKAMWNKIYTSILEKLYD